MLFLLFNEVSFVSIASPHFRICFPLFLLIFFVVNHSVNAHAERKLPDRKTKINVHFSLLLYFTFSLIAVSQNRCHILTYEPGLAPLVSHRPYPSEFRTLENLKTFFHHI